MSKSPSATGLESSTNADHDLCLRYLLGETSANEAASFESRLAESPELATVLMEQSATICQLSQASVSAPLTIAGDQTSSDTSHPGPWVEALVAIAACVAVGFFAWSETSNGPRDTVALQSPNGTTLVESTPSEQSLIAQAWASTPQQTTNATTMDIETVNIENEWESIEEVDGSSLSWVMAAVESGVSIDG